MITPDTTNRPSARRGWLPLIIAGLVYTAVLSVVVVMRAESSTDFRDFWRTAEHFRQTGQVSSGLGVHNYLPFFVVFMAPWSHLPLKVAIVLFTVLSMGLLALTIVMAEALLDRGLESRPRPAMVLALILLLPYAHSCAVLGQLGLLLAFLIVATWFLVERGREWPAGVCLGLAVVIKILPAVLVVFFLLKQRWRVAAGSVVTAFVLGLGLTLAALGYERTITAHRAFYDEAAVAHSAKATLTAEHPRKAKYTNNALPIVLRRLLTRVNANPSPEGTELYVNVADLSRGGVGMIYGALLAVIVTISLAVALRVSKPWPPEIPQDVAALRAQFGVWCCLMLLAAPLVWTHYLALLYWPLALTTDRLERATSPRCRWCIAAAVFWVFCAVLLAWPAARAAGAQLASVAILWLALTGLALHRRQA
jgi:hypothetical protein